MSDNEYRRMLEALLPSLWVLEERTPWLWTVSHVLGREVRGYIGWFTGDTPIAALEAALCSLNIPLPKLPVKEDA